MTKNKRNQQSAAALTAEIKRLEDHCSVLGGRVTQDRMDLTAARYRQAQAMAAGREHAARKEQDLIVRMGGEAELARITRLLEGLQNDLAELRARQGKTADGRPTARQKTAV